ncbi:MAG: biotin/lipoate A/B protein ligase family protein [Halobacteriaceae archaeon]
MDREWRLVREEARTGPMNMALDEVAARTAADGGPRTARVYRWEPSTLSLGYAQDPATVDWEFCEREGIAVTRRPTGGGAIYHDAAGDVSYSVVLPADEQPGELLASYRELCDPLFDALDRLGVDAAFADAERPGLHDPACYLRPLHPAHDVVADGRKVSGNAQYRRRDAVVQHGSVSYALDPERHLACFADPGVTAAEFRERVASVRALTGVDREDCVAALEGALADWAGAAAGSWTDAELDAARELAAEKYATGAWTREREDPAD